jgi:hypothetical protein
MLFFVFATTRFGSTFKFTPIPSHSSQAPYGLLNENNLGSISSIVKPLSGQANFDENIIFSIFLYFFGKVSFSYSTKIKPSAKLRAVSTPSASLFPRSLLIIILSITIEISCFTFLFKLGNLSIS